MKVDLIIRPKEFTSFTSYYLEEFWNEFFNIKLYDPTVDYDKKRTLFAVWWMSVANFDPWVSGMKQKGYKIVVDNLWEKPTFRTDYCWLEHRRSMCWNESLWWHAEGYSNYRPQQDFKFIAFMQLRKQKPIRDKIVNELEHLLPQMLWSYLAKNKNLPNDSSDERNNQRYMHPSWYETTYSSVVVESMPEEMHVSEKSYKPIAYYHPYMIVGYPGTLKFLREYGFETFENLFDESYDNFSNFKDRLKIIKSNLENIELNSYDKLTTDKLIHNHNLFFNQDLAYKNIKENVVEKMLEYAET